MPRKKGAKVDKKLPPQPIGALTNREIEVLKLICAEMQDHDIALALGITTRTVNTHRYHMLKKIGARNVVGLVKYAIKTAIIEL